MLFRRAAMRARVTLAFAALVAASALVSPSQINGTIQTVLTSAGGISLSSPSAILFNADGSTYYVADTVRL